MSYNFQPFPPLPRILNQSIFETLPYIPAEFRGSQFNASYKGKPPTNPFLNGARNIDYNNPSLVSNEIFYGKDYPAPKVSILQHKPRSPYEHLSRDPLPGVPNWTARNRTEPNERSVSPSLPPLTKQDVVKWMKEGGTISPLTHLPTKPLPIRQFSQPPPEEKSPGEQPYIRRPSRQENCPLRSITPPPGFAGNNVPQNPQIKEQGRSLTPVQSQSNIPTPMANPQSGYKETPRESQPGEFKIKPIPTMQESEKTPPIENYYFSPKNGRGFHQPKEEDGWEKAFQARRNIKKIVNKSDEKEDKSSSRLPSVTPMRGSKSCMRMENVKAEGESERGVYNLGSVFRSEDDEYCVNCINHKMVENRRVEKVRNRKVDKEKEIKICKDQMKKKEIEEKIVKDERKKRVEETAKLQRVLEDEYERKLEVRRNKGEEISANLFDDIFVRQDKINKQQREIFQAGLKGLQEKEDPRRKRSPKEKFLEALDKKEPRQFGDAYHNKYVSSPKKIVDTLKDQVEYKRQKKRLEKHYDQVEATETHLKEIAKIEQEKKQNLKKINELKEMQKQDLEQNMARKEALKEEEKEKKLMEREKIEKEAERQKKKRIEEESQRKRKILGEQKHAMAEMAMDAKQKKQKEKDWLEGQKKRGYDGSVLNNMAIEKQREIKHCNNCDKDYMAVCLSKGTGFFD